MATLKRSARPALAYEFSEGPHKALPVLVFLGGFRSDMTGTKAVWLKEWCTSRGQSYLRFDYSGHGQSEGDFGDQTLTLWSEDAWDVIEAAAPNRPVVLAGSSMGGWIALRLADRLGARLQGLVGIAAAPDFTREISARLTPAQHQILKTKGRVMVPSDMVPGTEYPITQALLQDGEKNILLDQTHTLRTRIRLLHGLLDQDVAPKTAQSILQVYPKCETRIVWVEDGDHRLGRPMDLRLLGALIDDVCESSATPLG